MNDISSLPPNTNTGNHNYLRNRTLDNKKSELDEPEFNPSMTRRNTKNDSIKGFSLKPQVLKEETSLGNNYINIEAQNSMIEEQPSKVECTRNDTKVDHLAEQPEQSSCNLVNPEKRALTEEAPYIKNDPLTKKYCLVLDLDETLVHYKVDSRNPDEGEMLVRPYMFECLSSLSKYYELILWTAGTEEVSFLTQNI